MFFSKATSGDNNPLWYVFGVFAVIFGYIIGQTPLLLVQWYKVSNDDTIGTAEVAEFLETMNFSLIHINKNVGLLLMIIVFAFALLAFMLAVKHLHKMPFKNLITPKSKIDLKKIFFGFGLWFALALAFEIVMALVNPGVYYMNFKPLSWIFLLLICIFILPIQTSLEELVIRGYIMPGMSLITKNKWIPWVASSMIFGLIHGMNPEVEKYGFWTMELYYVGAGLFLGLITILDDSLELALGVHAATNMFGAAFFSFDGSVLQTDSMVKASEINPLMMSLTFFLGAVIFILICNKKYNWGGFKRLFEPIGSSYETVSASNELFEQLD